MHCGICLRLRRRRGRLSDSEEPPVVEPDPGPSDEQRIADAREAIAGIVTEANAIEQSARSAVTAVESNADATDEQIANARAEGNAALDALRAIIRASGAANAATTPAAAEGALASARTALSTLRSAQSAVAGIQSRVEAVANLREQEAEARSPRDERLLAHPARERQQDRL